MADKKLYDADGKEIGVAAPKEAPAAKTHYDVNGSPLQLNPSGVKQPLGSELYTPQTEGTAEQAAPYVGRLAANSLPFAGSTLFGPGGTIGGSVVKQTLQNMAPNLFGQPPSDPIFEGATDVVLNDAIPGLLGGIKGAIQNPAGLINKIPGLSSFPAVREGAVKELTKQITSQFPKSQSQILTEAAQGAATNPTERVAAERAFVHGDETLKMGGFRNAGLGNEMPEKFRGALKDLLAGKGSYSELSKEVLKDVQSVRNFNLATGNPQLTEELAINQLLRSGSEKAEGVINAKTILNQMGKSEVFKEAIRPETASRFTELLGEMASQQKNPKFDYLLNYASGKLSFALTGALLGGPVGHTAAAGGALALTNKALAKMMANPETAKLVVEAMRTPAGTPKANLITRALSGFLKPNQSKLAIGVRAAEDLMTVPEQ